MLQIIPPLLHFSDDKIVINYKTNEGIMKNYFLLFVGIFAINLFGADSGSSGKTRFLLVGNPGVGKSTLINTFLGNAKCKAGLSAGEGLTLEVQECDFDGKILMDTPGLADIKNQDHAAKEIESALKRGDKYHIFFVFSLINLRVAKQDIASMEMILDSINVEDKKFNIIINNIREDEQEQLSDKKEFTKLLFTIENASKYKTKNVLLINHDPTLRKKLEKIITLKDDIKEFFFNRSAFMSIPPSKVNKIEIDKFEKLAAEAKKRIDQLEKDAKERSAAFRELEERLQRANAGDDGFWSAVGGIIGGIVTAVAVFL